MVTKSLKNRIETSRNRHLIHAKFLGNFTLPLLLDETHPKNLSLKWSQLINCGLNRSPFVNELVFAVRGGNV